MDRESFRQEIIGDLDVERDCDVIANKAAKLISTEFRELAHTADAYLDSEGMEKLKKAETGTADDKYEYAQYLRHESGREGFDLVEEEWNRCSLYWYSEAAILGCLRAYRELGEAFHWTCEDYGEECLSASEDAAIPADEDVSLACYFVAARSNDAYSGYHVFLHFVHNDYAKAVEWAGRFSALPYIEDTTNESYDQYQDRLYIKNCQNEIDLVLGKGEQLDPARWKPWERFYAFGICHEHGWRIEKDLNKALEYYRESANLGCQAAIDAIKRLEPMSGTLKISDLLKTARYVFSIPSYQRGYRWRKENVESLLDDLLEFAYSKRNIYCLQPLVLQKIHEEFMLKQDGVRHCLDYRIVDGQQRMTTLTIVLRVMGLLPPWNLYYEQAEGKSKSRLLSELLDEELRSDSNHGLSINGVFRKDAGKAVRTWLNKHNDADKNAIVDVLKGGCDKEVVFVGYVLPQTDINPDASDKVDAEHDSFMRLNDGKVDLTSAELIKALYMIDTNGLSKDEKSEIVKEWELIEQELRDERLWRIFNRNDKGPFTRIEHLFACIADTSDKQLRYDSLAVFHDIEQRIKKSATEKDVYRPEQRRVELLVVWSAVLEMFWWMRSCAGQTEVANFLGWITLFADFQLKSIYECFNAGTELKDDSATYKEEAQMKGFNSFKRHLMAYIGSRILGDFQNGLEGVYYTEGDFTNAKKLRELLVLLNILVCNGNGEIFRFDRYHREDSLFDLDGRRKESSPGKRGARGWQIEHIRSKETAGNIVDHGPEDINRVWNLTLLDARTNEGYHNAPFPTKREWLQSNMDSESYYVVPLTQRVFMKFYSSMPTGKDGSTWEKWDEWTYKTDGEPYFEKMKKLFNAFMQDAVPEAWRPLAAKNGVEGGVK